MAEPTGITYAGPTMESDDYGVYKFNPDAFSGSGGSIFSMPSGILNQVNPIGADAASGFLTGAAPTFSSPLSGYVPGAGTFTFAAPGSMMGNTFLNSPSGLGPSGIDWSSTGGDWWNSTTTAANPDMTGVKLSGTPYRNVTISGSQPVSPSSAIGQGVQTGNAGDVVTMDPFTVNAGGVGPQFLPANYTVAPVTGGNALLGGVSTASSTGDNVVVMDPFKVTDFNLPKVSFNFSQGTQTGTGDATTAGGATSGVTTLPPYTVTDNRDKTSPFTSEQARDLLNRATANWGTTPITLPPVTADPNNIGPGVKVVDEDYNIKPPPLNPIVGPAPVAPPPPPPPPPPPNQIVPPLTFAPVAGGSGTAGGTTSTSSAMTERDLAKELAKTLPALQGNQAAIQKMYGDLYSQFMPKGLSQTEQGVIDQYTADLNRLQQRQAGILSPEDVRQSQQAAREAYGARGQVMGRGAIGAEILNREAIRQQREDQARAAMQQSYGNILNMSNLQTGNLFSPIASLISGTFNPLGAYPADVYGTNVNAQLAREIAQKNYDAAVKAAELQGSAAKSAANTSIFGDILKVGGAVKVAMACMPGDQLIDTPNGSKSIEDIRGGDEVIGYDGLPHRVLQVCSYIESPETEFLTFSLETGRTITVCDKHRILDIPAMEWVVGAKMNGLEIKRIDKKVGVTTSFDLVTEIGGYQIAGVPVNSMIPEMLALTMQLVALKHA